MPDIDFPMPVNEATRVATRAYKGRYFRRGRMGRGTKESVPTGTEATMGTEAVEEVIEEELIIEDFTIDGICGVY